MAVYNCGFGQLWRENGTFAGLSNEKNSMHFISTNGYYGYLPIYAGADTMVTNGESSCLENNCIGTVPNSPESPCSGNTMQHLSRCSTNERCIVQKITTLPRKRNSSEEMDENHKRIKKEESPYESTGGYQVSLQQPTRNTDYHYPRCTMGHYV